MPALWNLTSAVLAEAVMKLSSAFIVIAFCLLQIQPASADCAEIDTEISARRSAFIIATESYKRDSTLIRGKPLSKEVITMGIVLNAKMKIAIDELIDILNRAMTEGCFGGDAIVWRDLISKLKEESDAIEKVIQTYIGSP